MIMRVVGNRHAPTPRLRRTGACSLQVVTIEPNDRRYLFCKISKGKIILNAIGKIIDARWRWIFDRYDHIKMNAYIIMPDHMHEIIRILHDSQLNGSGEILLDSQLNVRAGLDPPFRPRATRESPVHLDQNHSKKIGLSLILSAFKSKSSKLIHLRS